MSIRAASHAGSWYADSASRLEAELDKWLGDVPKDLPGVGHTPIPGARVVIAPHAGYQYSGPCAAWAYRSLDLSTAKRVFIIHPSHHVALSTIALPTCKAYMTPLSDFPIPLDLETIAELSQLTTPTNQKFSTMTKSVDEAEHSAEMQLPYLHRLFQSLCAGQPESAHPPLVPIMVGSTSDATEAAFGRLLAPYVADPENAFVISSDFCHWGSRFAYTYYLPSSPSPAASPLALPNGVHEDTGGVVEGDITAAESAGSVDLASKQNPKKPAIWESIAHVDRACMRAIATGEVKAFRHVLQQTGNTICGRHPIGVFMEAWEEVLRGRKEKGEEGGDGKFRFVRYERSGNVVAARDSSVSYVSAFAVL